MEDTEQIQERKYMEGYVLKQDNVVTGLDRCHPFTDGLNNASAFMAEHDGKGSFRIFA